MTLEELSAQAQNNYALYKSGKITTEEFKELTADIDIQTKIAESSSNLENDIFYHNIIISIINAASLLQITNSLR